MTAPLVVTGTGRCGTGAVAAALTRAGVPCGHEDGWSGRYGYRLPTERADAAWQAAPHLHRHDGPVLHVVRHPYDVVRSFVGIGFFEKRSAFSDYARFWMPALPDDPLAAACDWWNRWNRSIEAYADVRLRIEDLRDGGLNHRRRADIADEAIRPHIDPDTAARYGYEL